MLSSCSLLRSTWNSFRELWYECMHPNLSSLPVKKSCVDPCSFSSKVLLHDTSVFIPTFLSIHFYSNKNNLLAFHSFFSPLYTIPPFTFFLLLSFHNQTKCNWYWCVSAPANRVKLWLCQKVQLYSSSFRFLVTRKLQHL